MQIGYSGFNRENTVSSTKGARDKKSIAQRPQSQGNPQKR